MVKKLKKLLKANWIRRCSVLMSCVLILLCCLAPSASAFLIDQDASTKFQSILDGTLTLSYYPVLEEDVSLADRVYHIGGRLPFIAQTGTNLYGENIEDFLLSTLNDPEWSIETVTRIARYKSKLTSTSGSSYTFDKVRYNIASFETASGNRDSAYYRTATYNLNPYFFNSFDSTYFSDFINLRLTSPCKVQTTVKYSFYDTESNSIRTVTATSLVENIGNSNVHVHYPLDNIVAGSDPNAILNNVPEFSPVMIESISIIVQPEDFTNPLSGVSMELLAEQWSTGNPRFIRDDSISAWTTYVNAVIKRVVQGGIDLPDVEANLFTRWFAGAVGGFLDFEFAPGFSLGNILRVLVTVLIVIIILKVFGGG